jgi:hypothetical protein
LALLHREFSTLEERPVPPLSLERRADETLLARLELYLKGLNPKDKEGRGCTLSIEGRSSEKEGITGTANSGRLKDSTVGTEGKVYSGEAL